MRSGSPQPFYSRLRCRRRQGFTLLELTIAMTFVAFLAGGIALTISTCLNVWRRSLEAADTNQEARAIIELLSRDVRGAYLGIDKTAGYFIGTPAEEGAVPIDTLELCTESDAVDRAALMPDELRAAWSEYGHGPISDYVAVWYGPPNDRKEAPGGLYRTTWVVPVASGEEGERQERSAPASELISDAVAGLTLQYLRGGAWVASWSAMGAAPELPWAVAIELTLRDARGSDHVYQTIVQIPTR